MRCKGTKSREKGKIKVYNSWLFQKEYVILQPEID